MSKINLLVEDSEREVKGSISEEKTLLNQEAMESFDWELEEQKLCNDDQCIFVPDDKELIFDGQLNLNTLADLLNRPIAQSSDQNVVYVGPPYTKHRDDLKSGRAPDFTLPSLDGEEYSLSDFEGNKVFLLVWASW